MRGPILRRFLAACACACALAAAASAQDREKDPKERRIVAVFLNRTAQRVVAVASRRFETHARLIDRAAEKEIVVATPFEFRPSGGFLCDDRLVLLSGYGRKGPVSAVLRMEDGADLCRPSDALSAAAGQFPSIANTGAVASTDGRFLCTVARDGVVEVRSAQNCEIVKRVRPEDGVKSVLAFVGGDDLVVSLATAVVARVRVSDGKLLWRTKLWQVPPPALGEPPDLSGDPRPVGYVDDARVVRDAGRVVFRVSTAVDDREHAAWRALIALDWQNGTESWRMERDSIDRVFVAQRQRVVGLANDGVKAWDAATGEFVGEARLSTPFVGAVADSDESDTTYCGSGFGEILTVPLGEFDRRPATPTAPGAKTDEGGSETK